MKRSTETIMVLIVWTAFALAGCRTNIPATVEGTNEMSIQITSEAFKENGTIPKKYSCDGENISPPLAWTGVPSGSKSLALIVDDPDAPSGSFVHWVIYNIDPTRGGLPEGVPLRTPAGLGMQGRNNAGRSGYSGPCPPKGSSHRYFFRLYALDLMLDIGPDASRSKVDGAMKNHVLATGQLVGIFSH